MIAGKGQWSVGQTKQSSGDPAEIKACMQLCTIIHAWLEHRLSYSSYVYLPIGQGPGITIPPTSFKVAAEINLAFMQNNPCSIG